MNKQVIKVSDMQRFTAECFDRPEECEKAARILKGILDARSPRISDIAHAMEGSPEANYKAIQRFLDSGDPKRALCRLYWEQAPFIIGDPTDIERPQARKTKYVGELKDGKTPGFQILPLAFPYRGRAIPFSFITYSSKTSEDECSSRNLEHYRIIRELRDFLCGKPLVLDREFSYQRLFENMAEEALSFVIRLNTGNRPTITDEEGKKVTLSICPGERVFLRGVYDKGKVNPRTWPGTGLAWRWDRGLRQPLWVISDLDPEEAMAICQARMKIEQSFRDLKSLLGLDKIMNKSRQRMEKMAAMMLLAYSIALLIGEESRDRVHNGRTWKIYSGLFILLKQRVQLARGTIANIINQAYSFFRGIVLGDVRTHV